MTPVARLHLFHRLSAVAAVLALCVVVLGAWVRLNDAGLGCPDWPGCYGHVSAGAAELNLQQAQERYPQRRFVYAKAVKEMIHRYFASSLGVLIVALAVLAYRNRHAVGQPLRVPLLLVPLVLLQGLLGMWTVTLLLKPLIVSLHLMGGLTTMALLAWQAMPKPKFTDEQASHPRPLLKKLALLGLVMLALQIFLGGWTSSNYAAVSCPDFPTCQASYWPHMDVKDAFVLWRGLGIDYEGGVLDHPARVAIHFVHRLGALVITALLLGITCLAWRTRLRNVQLAGVLVAAALLLQLTIGATMVVQGFPLWLATLHNAGAALLLLSMVRLNQVLWARRDY